MPLVPFSPLITTGVVQFVFKVSSGLIVAVVIQRYPSLDLSGGTTDHPEGVLTVAFNVGGFELLVFTANLNSVNLPSWAWPSLPLTGITSDHSVTSPVSPLTVPIHCHQLPLVVG